MLEIMTKIQFARHVGVKRSTVSSWIARRKLSGAALTADGRILVDEATRQLASRLDLAKSTGRAPSGLFSRVAKPEATAQIATPIPGERVDSERLATKRGDLLELELHRKEFDRLLAAGKLIPVSKFTRELGERLSRLIQIVDAALPEWANLARDAETAKQAVARIRGRLEWVSGSAQIRP